MSSHKIVITVPIPRFPGAPPLTLHTIVRDDQKNLYLSDEYSHRVISLSSSGSVRWKVGEKGKGECQFNYPRGMAIGKIRVTGEDRHCLAVCDSWNNRISFFDLNGTYLNSWHAAGERGFKEACDIRYMQSTCEEDSGYWLVLDRGNHRLCALAADGQLLVELGRAFPQHLESRWEKTSLEAADDPAPRGFVHSLPVFDPLYYPTRILGQSETALYLFEPLAKQLKQPLFGILFPLAIRPPNDGEWISAVEGVFLAWNRITKRISWLDASGNTLSEASITGTPVISDLGAGEVWLHLGDQIELWLFEAVKQYANQQDGGDRFQALISTAAEEIASSENAGMFRIMLDALQACLAECDEFLSYTRKGGRDAVVFDSIQSRAMACWEGAGADRKPKAEQIHKLWLSSHKLRLLMQSCNHPEILRNLRTLQASFESATKPLADAAIEAVKRRDQAYQLRLSLQALGQESSNLIAIWAQDKLSGFLQRVIQEMLQWGGTQFRHTALMVLPIGSDGGGLSEGLPVKWIAPPRIRSDARISRCLCESGRFDLLSSDIDAPPNPFSIAQTSGGDYYVTLFSRGTLAHLDAEGKRIGEILGTGSACGTLFMPLGLAVDSLDRIWIVERLRPTVKIYDPRTGEMCEMIPSSGSQNFLAVPVGIGPGPCGSMLVTDVCLNRIVALNDQGSAHIFCGHEGTEPGEFRCPVGMCRSAPSPETGFWIVDQRNHRLQKFDHSGKFIQQVGRCGSGKGSLLEPLFVAQFPDGNLVVSQYQFEQCLKVFSPEGEELDCLFLDYKPAGLLISSDRLLVVEWSGRSVRIYERTR